MGHAGELMVTDPGRGEEECPVELCGREPGRAAPEAHKDSPAHTSQVKLGSLVSTNPLLGLFFLPIHAEIPTTVGGWVCLDD